MGVVDMGVDKMANIVVDMEFERWTDRDRPGRPVQTGTDHMAYLFREGLKKTFWGESFSKCMKPPTYPRVFVRFGKTKGEIRVEKGDFRGDLGGF